MIIAEAFNLAFDRWKEKNKEENSTSGKCEVCKCGCRLAVERDNSEDTLANSDSYKQREETSVNYGIRENKHYSKDYIETSQSPGCKFIINEYIMIYCEYFKGRSCSSTNCDKMDPLLIDLRSPDDTLEDENMCWHIDKKNHIKAGIEGNDEIDFKLLR